MDFRILVVSLILVQGVVFTQRNLDICNKSAFHCFLTSKLPTLFPSCLKDKLSFFVTPDRQYSRTVSMFILLICHLAEAAAVQVLADVSIWVWSIPHETESGLLVLWIASRVSNRGFSRFLKSGYEVYMQLMQHATNIQLRLHRVGEDLKNLLVCIPN